jgi:lysophospholipase L1-like esterase
MVNRTVVLLGDSILDNEPYTDGAPDTAAHLRSILGSDWPVELLARDGATMEDIASQLHHVPNREAIAIVSIGGNDLAQHIEVLTRESTTSEEVFGELLEIAERFSTHYEEVARSVAASAQRIVLCTIYEVQLEPTLYAGLARVPLGVLNDRIIRTAARMGFEVLELRDVCTLPSDFVMQIEPSARGARKIAEAIARVVRNDPAVRTARVHSAGTM